MIASKKNQLILLVTILQFCTAGARAQEDIPSTTQNERYAIDRNFFKFPNGRVIGSAPSIDISPDGKRILVIDRCSANDCVGSDLDPILEFDLSGELIRSFGSNLFIRPHGLHVDYLGNIWVTDGEGPNDTDPRRMGKGHQVFKFSPLGELLMTLGSAGIAGNGEYEFNEPSDVVVAPNGDIFVGDGHGGNSNARIVKYSGDGTYISSWGRKGTGTGEFEAPHTLAMDSRGRLFVGDRGNSLVQIFDQDGVFLEEWSDLGQPSGIYIDSNDILYVTDATSRVSASRGIRIASTTDGVVFNFIPDTEETASQEGIVVDSSGTIYGASTRGMSLQKYTKLD